MRFVLYDLIIETTRRCNLQCAHCMRGLAENIDITKEIVDAFFENNNLVCIDKILFSGGEPTLNPEIIIYIIDKIIQEYINVCELIMVTNGQHFSKDLMDAFNRFNEYRNTRIKKIYSNKLLENDLKNLIEKNHVRITFSTDKYHPVIDPEVKTAYSKYSKHLNITTYSLKDEDIYKTGLSTTGKNFDYKLENLEYFKERENYYILNSFYITATGYITSEVMGQYKDMDNTNMGHVSETTIEEILANYGTPIFNTPKISLPKCEPYKKLLP